MRFGLHLPQAGHVAGPDQITAAARLAEQLGFDDLWVSDHLVVPVGQTYPSPYLYDPLMALAWAGAATEVVGLGTAVLVLPQHQPVQLANSLASLDALTKGRLLLGVGVGWSRGEFEALGQRFSDRGKRTDEAIPLLRACWRDDPVAFDGVHHHVAPLRLLPKPAHEIPIWVGGRSEAAFRRAVTLGDGYQALGLSVEQAGPVVERVRRDRPDPAFTISLRTGWDALGMDQGLIREERAAFEEAGIQHVVATPWRKDFRDYCTAVEQLAGLLQLTPRR